MGYKIRVGILVLIMVFLIFVTWKVLTFDRKASDFSWTATNLCYLLQGEIRTEITGVGIAPIETKGCFPPGKTVDEGMICETNDNCEGDCMWIGGDMVTGTDQDKFYYQCSSYKRPIFTENNKIIKYLP